MSQSGLFPTTIAGSLPKPSWLAETEKLWPSWRLEGEALEQAKKDASLVWLKIQEVSGIDIVSNGEQFRTHFVHGFLEHIDGVDWSKKKEIAIRGDRYLASVPTVTGPVRRRQPIHAEEVRFTRAHTANRLKFTLPGPMTICDTIANTHYENRADMAMAFAEVLNAEAKELAGLGIDVIQFDEPAFNIYFNDVRDWGIETLKKASEGLSCKIAVHICYGYGIPANNDWKASLGSEWRQYEKILPAINETRIDQVSLECAGSNVPMELLALLKDKEILVGAIDVATQRVETPEEVAATIRAATRYADAERIYPCTNCGMAPLPRTVAAGKLAALGAGAKLARQEFGAGHG